MKPHKIGQIVKFHSPYQNEDPNQQYVIVDIFTDVERPRSYIKPLNVPGILVPTSLVLVDDLEVVEVQTIDLLHHQLTIVKDDNSKVFGEIIDVQEHKVNLDLKKVESGIETNVVATLLDEFGNEHIGKLFVPKEQTT